MVMIIVSCATFVSACHFAYIYIYFLVTGRKEDESHFHVVVVSEQFGGMPIIKRHQAIMNLFKDESGSLKFHALRITAKTLPQWEKMQGNTPDAPKCTGKGDGRGPTDVTKL
jgi:stress-induced morphogen